MVLAQGPSGPEGTGTPHPGHSCGCGQEASAPGHEGLSTGLLTRGFLREKEGRREGGREGRKKEKTQERISSLFITGSQK